MILELDIGNSRAKWRILDDAGRRVAGGANDRKPTTLMSGIPPVSIGAASLERVRVSNVTGSETDSLIRAWCASVGKVAPEFARSEARRGPVTNGYSDPARMGVDRWLAVLAAWARTNGPCCVVDCGSALTIDFLDRDGAHLGGLIAPGLTMMRNSLLRDTREILLIDDEPLWDSTRVGGNSTETAVLGGIIGMARELIVASLRRFAEQTGAEVPLLMTGGEAEVVGAHLSIAWEHCPDLVFDGLAVALP